MKKNTSIELFTGAGGLALGLSKSGWHHLALIEKNKHACYTIHMNESLKHSIAKNWKLYSEDVRDFKYNQITDTVDMVAGGPPCQPFSLGGKHRAYRDNRDMFPEAVRAVRELQPKCFLFENVKGLLRQSFSTYFNYIILQLTYPTITRFNDEDWQKHLSRLECKHTGGMLNELSYRVVFRLLNACDYGVPQNRHRVFIVGFRSDLGKEWSFPEPTHSLDRLLWDQWVDSSYWSEHEVSKKLQPQIPRQYKKRVERLLKDNKQPCGKRYKTVRDALFGLPDPICRYNTIINHEFRDGARPYPGHTGSFFDSPSKALKAGAHGVPGGENMIMLPNGKYRYYTVRESARIQTFPDDYIFSGSWTEAMRQIGNAVPMKLATVVGESIRKQMLKES